jgi:hypothetical protein
MITFLVKSSSVVLAAGNMSENSTCHTFENPLDPTPPSQTEPLNVPLLSFLTPHLSDVTLASCYSESSSNPLGKVLTEAEFREELEGQARMTKKVKDVELKKASKARDMEGKKGKWWPCNLTDFDLKTLQDKGFIAPKS